MELTEKFIKYFNDKDVALLISIFSDGITSKCLFSDKNDFSSKGELKEVYKELFRINSKVTSKILEQVTTPLGMTWVKSYENFFCGAKSKTVWNIKIENNKISEILHWSENVK